VDLEDLRVAVYRSFAGTGRPPELEPLANRFDTSQDAVVDGLRDLARARHLVLDSGDRIVMAHPFAAIPLGFSVMGRSTLWWGGGCLFCSADCVARWLERSGNERGYVMDLATLWRLASQWYAGRLDYGYARRDPGAAAEYFRQVGLSGPFWGR
jgi:hypothetical protein